MNDWNNSASRNVSSFYMIALGNQFADGICQLDVVYNKSSPYL